MRQRRIIRTPPEMDPRQEKQLLVFLRLLVVEVEDVVDLAEVGLGEDPGAVLLVLLPVVVPDHAERAIKWNSWGNVVPSDVPPVADWQGGGGRGDGRGGGCQGVSQQGESGAQDGEPHGAGAVAGSRVGLGGWCLVRKT